MHDDAPPATVARRWHLTGFALLTLIGAFGMAEALRLGLWRQHSPGEGLFPFIAATAMTAFSLFGAAAAWQLRAAAPVPAVPVPAVPVSHVPASAAGGVRRIAIYVVGLVFYGAALDALGFIVATLVAVVFILRVGERYSWRAALALAAGTAVVCQVLFVVWLGAILPTGFLWDSLLNPG